MSQTVASSHRLAGASFPVRHMKFVFSGLSSGMTSNPVMDNWLATMSSMFPDGEMFFVHSVRAMRESAKTERLSRDISAFIGQEAMHAREHASFNAALATEGYDTSAVSSNVAWLMSALKRYMTPTQCLAVTAAAEHFTAILAKQLMSREDVQALFHDEENRRIWLWHAIEESEHKAVAMDLYRDAGGGEFLRLLAYVPTSIYMGVIMATGTLSLCASDQRCRSVRSYAAAFSLMLGRRGFITTLWREYLDYFSLGFHPNDHNTQQLEAKTRRQLDLQEL